MRYSGESLQQLLDLVAPRASELRDAQLRCLLECDKTSSSDAVEHLTHGAGRRINVLQHALEKIFQLLPPSIERPIDRSDLNDVQINLHAFLINLVGLFDNFAWAFAHHHGLDDLLAKPMGIDLFKPEFQKSLPPDLVAFLTTSEISSWHKDYLKNYRDALAHRIPLYVPPSNIFGSDRDEYERLEALRHQLQQELRLEEADSVREQQLQLEHPCFAFAHSFKAGASIGPLYVHPQLLADAGTALSITNEFLDNWLSRA